MEQEDAMWEWNRVPFSQNNSLSAWNTMKLPRNYIESIESFSSISSVIIESGQLGRIGKHGTSITHVKNEA